MSSPDGTDRRLAQEWFEVHFDAISRYLHRRLSPSDVEDAVAEVFLRALRASATFEDRGDGALPWLYGIASNVVANQRRSERRRLRAMARAASEAAGVHLDAQHQGRPGLDPAVVGVLCGMKFIDREALLLLAWGELSYAEIAEALQVPVGTVRSRIARARKQLAPAIGAVTDEVAATTKMTRISNV